MVPNGTTCRWQSPPTLLPSYQKAGQMTTSGNGWPAGSRPRPAVSDLLEKCILEISIGSALCYPGDSSPGGIFPGTHRIESKEASPCPAKPKPPPPASSSAHIKSIAITAICLVLVFVFTALVNIRLPFAPQRRADPPGEPPPLRGRHPLRQAHRDDRRGASAWPCLT